MNFKPVILETPYAGDIAANVEFAQLCMRDMLCRNESPYASHLLLTQPNVLDDSLSHERESGILAGFAWKRLLGVKTVAYLDLGMSRGMQQAKDYCIANNLPWEERFLNKEGLCQ